MALCNICLGTLNVPSALPCGKLSISFSKSNFANEFKLIKGHVFCYSCILKVVRSVRPFTTEHRCPMCRERYTVGASRLLSAVFSQLMLFTETIPSELVPEGLQRHITPSIRKLDLSFSSQSTQSVRPTTSPCEPTPCDGLERHQAEILALRAQRAELARRNQQASTTAAGLCSLAKAAQTWGMKMQRERDALAKELGMLRKRLREETSSPVSSRSSASSCPTELDSVFCSAPLLSGPGVPGGDEASRPRKRQRAELPHRMQAQVPVDILGPSISRRTTPRVPSVKYEPLSPSLSPISLAPSS